MKTKSISRVNRPRRDRSSETLRRTGASQYSESAGKKATRDIARGRPSDRSRGLQPNAETNLQTTLVKTMVDGVGANATVAAGYSKMLGNLDLMECVRALAAETRRVQKGDLALLESTLAAQAVTLNAMFTQLAHEAANTIIVDHIDRFTRLAFKAQSQCRATVETLALIKNPPTVIARQANISHGPQQVNTAVVTSCAQGSSALRASDSKFERNELLEAHGEWLDAGTARPSVEGHQDLAAVGASDRTANKSR